MKQLVAIVVFAIALASCNDDEDPSPTDILTVQFGDPTTPFVSNAVTYVFASNDDGDVLDIMEVVPGKIDTLRGLNVSDKVSLTVFNYLKVSNTTYYLTTYTSIAVGSKIKLGYKVPTDNSPIPDLGYADFEIKNYRGPTDSPYGLEFSNGIYNGGSVGIIESGVFKIRRNLPSNSTTEMIAGYRDGVPVYALIKNIKNADVVKLDYNVDFKPHEKVVDLGSLNSYGILYGRYNGERSPGRVLGSTNPLSNTNIPHKIGYIDGFDSYYSYMGYYPGGESFIYTRTKTPVPTTFTWPSYGVTIVDRTLPNPQVTTTTTKFIRCSWNLQSDLGGGTHISWSIVGEKISDLKMVDIPEALTTKFPDLKTGKLSFASFSLAVTPDAYTYQNWITDEFSGLAEKTVLSEWMEYYKF